MQTARHVIERRVTVVVPTRNRRALLARALTSVAAQVAVEVELVVVDEASTDDTRSYLGSPAAPPATVVRNDEPVGVARARNQGLAAASGPWVAFLDDDDLWAPERLSAQLDALERAPAAGWATSAAVVVDDALRVIGAQRPPRDGVLPAGILAYNCIPGGASGVLARTDLVREAGGFDPGFRILADWDLWTRLALVSPLATVWRPHVAYVLHGANMTARPRGFDAELDRVRTKHAAARAAAGVELDEDAWARWFAEVARRGGSRRLPAITYARLAVRRRRPWLALKGLSVAVRPGWVERLNAHRRETMEPGWLDEAEAWLTPFATPPHRDPATPGTDGSYDARGTSVTTTHHDERPRG